MVSLKGIDVGAMEDEIYSQWKAGNTEHNTSAIHEALQKHIPHDKRKDKRLLCLWCMIDRVYKDAYTEFRKKHTPTENTEGIKSKRFRATKHCVAEYNGKRYMAKFYNDEETLKAKKHTTNDRKDKNDKR